MNSDARKYGGQGMVNEKIIMAIDYKWNNQPYSIDITIPPLSTVFLKPRLSNEKTQLQFTEAMFVE